MAPSSPILPKTTQDVDESKYSRHGLSGGSTTSSLGACLKGRRARTVLYASLLFMGSVWLITHFGHKSWSIRQANTVDAHGQAMKPDQQSSNDAAAIAAVEGDLTEALDVGLPFKQEKEQVTETEEEKEKPLPVEAEVRKMMQRYPVLVFSKSYCPFSKKAKEILATYKYKVPIQIVEVDLRDDGPEVKRALTLMTGRSTFPNVFINGESIGGGDEVASMQHTGQLVDVLTKAEVLA
ncbi:hypothetical protein INT43_008662 [Umbelopsis isabellina]|uniref:Glutaredoxin domain-containing protein n=1 Tax=Mortierella isabellina TaxID=91625 RepID=A0A8H7PWM1_MORIS|nr:hypothetical protein INT43_008662 [Umbelopsis isabellina]